MSDKILVVGATSKVGTELVEILAKEGAEVVAATRHPDEYDAAHGEEATNFDYAVHGWMKPALQDVDRVFMLSPWTDLHPEMTVNRFIEHAIVEDVRHVTYLSMLGVDKKPQLGPTMVEKHIQKSGIDYTILRPNWFMQNFSRGFFRRPISDISKIVAPAGQARVSFVDTRDIAAVAAASLTDSAPHAGKTYSLTGGQALSYDQVAGVFEDVTGRRIAYQDASDEDFTEILSHYWEPEQSEYLLGVLAQMRAGEAATIDPTLESVLGRQPTTFEQFVRDHADIWQ